MRRFRPSVTQLDSVPFDRQNYEALKAAEKQALLFDQCVLTEEEGEHSSTMELLQIMWRDINPTFDHSSDFKAYEGKKPIHGKGPIVGATF